MNIGEWSRRWNTAVDELRTAPRDREPDTSALHGLWAKAWDETFAFFVQRSTRNDHVSFDDLLSIDGGQELALSLEHNKRACLVLFQRLELERFVEERTFSDYSAGFNQSLDGIAEEARELLEYTENGGKHLAALENLARLNLAKISGSQLANNIAVLKGIVAAAKEHAQAILEHIDSRFRTALLDKVKAAWDRIDADWSTGQRRCKQPAYAALWTAVAALIAYGVFGSLLPTRVLVWPALALPLIAGTIRYYAGRKALNKSVERLRSLLTPLHPRALEQGLVTTTVSTIWDGAPKAVLESVKTDLSGKLTFRGTPSGFPILAGAVVGSVVLCAVAVSAWGVAWPEYEIVGRGPDDRVCALGRGTVIWPGPVDLVLNERLAGPTVIPSTNILRVQRDNGFSGFESCPGTARAKPAVLFLSTVIGGWDHGNQEDLVLVPFPGPVYGCDEANLKRWSRLKQPAKRMLKRLSEAFTACSAHQAVEIDVRGYASSKAFEDCPNSDALNVALAELRREAVLIALGAIPHESGAWHADRFVVSPDSPDRWDKEIAAMRQAAQWSDRTSGGVDPVKEALTRSVSVSIRHKGDCSPGASRVARAEPQRRLD